MASKEAARIAAISWEGDSWQVLKSWPKPVRWDFGNSLREMQYGRPAKLNVRPMQSIGQGVFELKDSDDNSWYRMVYLARVKDVIYVLDCFEKDRTQGSEHSQEALKQRVREERRNEKHKPQY